MKEAAAHARYSTPLESMLTALGQLALCCALLGEPAALACWTSTLPFAQSAADAKPPPSSSQAQPAEASVEDEVLANIKHQPVGSATIDDFALPDEFLKRYADRIIRSTFEARYRIVVHDDPAAAAPAAADPTASTTPGSKPPQKDGTSWAVWSFPIVVLALASIVGVVKRMRRRAA
jgi:hypothetical protein